jgi:penicillin-binding protein 1A
VYDPKTSETITAILQQVINQGTGAGIRSRFGVKSNLAGKTGTAQHYSDAWFVAYTPNMVIGTWVGASTPDVHFNSSNGSGSALAMPIAANIIKNIEKNSTLRSRYLASFAFSDSVYTFLQCEPYHQIGIKGFFNRLFGKKESNDRDTTGKRSKKYDEDRGIRAFFKKLFGKKPE